MGEKIDSDCLAAREKMKDLIEKINVCMFCTKLTETPFASRPMGTIKVDEEGTIWFFSNKGSDKNQEVIQSGKVQLLYSEPSQSEFLCVYGQAEIVIDNEKAKELWQPVAKVWFQGGPDDADLSMIKITPIDGHYWDTKHGRMVVFAKMVIAAVTGATMDEGIEGQLSRD